MSNFKIDCLPADITLPNGTTHRIWLDDDSNTVIRVEGETITRELAQSEVDRIIAENTCYGEESTSDGI